MEQEKTQINVVRCDITELLDGTPILDSVNLTLIVEVQKPGQPARHMSLCRIVSLTNSFKLSSVAGAIVDGDVRIFINKEIDSGCFAAFGGCGFWWEYYDASLDAIKHSIQLQLKKARLAFTKEKLRVCAGYVTDEARSAIINAAAELKEEDMRL